MSNNTNAAYYSIPEAAAVAMSKDMDQEARKYWAYPDSRWQSGFEADWLSANGFEAAAQIALQDWQGE